MLNDIQNNSPFLKFTATSKYGSTSLKCESTFHVANAHILLYNLIVMQIFGMFTLLNTKK